MDLDNEELEITKLLKGINKAIREIKDILKENK